MKKIILGLLVVLLFLTACGGTGGGSKGPEATLDEFLQSAKKQDHQAMLNLLENDEGTENLKEVIADMEVDDDPMGLIMKSYVEEASKKLSYEILESEIDEDKAKISAEVVYANSEEFMAELFGRMFELLFDEDLDIDPESDEFYEALSELIEIKEPSETQKFKFNFGLVKKEDKWYLSDIEDDFMDVIMAGMISASENLDF